MSDERLRLSRREVLKTAAGAAFVTASASPAAGQGDGAELAGIRRLGPGPVDVALVVNGRPAKLRVEPRVTLLDALRDQLGLTGAKRVCDRGACGGCTVWVDGRTVNACLLLAVDAEGAQVTTIEGLSQGEELHPVQQAFVRHDALMCGFCTPGMVMTCAKLVEGGKQLSPEEVRRGLSGNLCRCGTYPHVFAALEEAGQ